MSCVSTLHYAAWLQSLALAFCDPNLQACNLHQQVSRRASMAAAPASSSDGRSSSRRHFSWHALQPSEQTAKSQRAGHASGVQQQHEVVALRHFHHVKLKRGFGGWGRETCCKAAPQIARHLCSVEHFVRAHVCTRCITCSPHAHCISASRTL